MKQAWIGMMMAAVLALPALAASPPLPRIKPGAAVTAPLPSVPLPRLKPGTVPDAPGAAVKPRTRLALPPAQEPAPPATGKVRPGLPQAAPVPLPSPAGEWRSQDIAAGRDACRQQLKGLDMVWSEAPAMGHPGGCGAAAPILVSQVAGLAIEPPALTSCAMAAGLHQWVSQTVRGAAQGQLGQRVTGLRNATAYACRGRNGARLGKLSEHAYANALDISAFRLADGSAVTVKEDWGLGLSHKAAFLKTVHGGLCRVFTTVLGPGSDGYHEDHFHTDMKARRGGYRICQ
jgi:hypothetical protein